jgi:glycosyltransferase involved in cell wall biosynthesis
MRAIVAVISDLYTDMRVQKHAEVLRDMGYSVNLVGRRSGITPLPSLNGITAERLRVPFRKGPLMYLFFNAALLLRLLARRADLYVSNDLDTLLPCLVASRVFGKPLVYDAHEYFTGQYGLPERRVKYNIWKWLEKKLLPRLNCMITVSHSIAEIYQSEYGISPVVVRNAAFSTAGITPVSRNEAGINGDDLLVVYQGSGINPGRGAPELLEAMGMVDGVMLMIIGGGDMIDEIKLEAGKRNLDSRVIFLPRMPWREMMRYTMCCDAGLTLDTDTCLNQRYSLPNKLFDYIAAGIPVIASPLPEVSALVSNYGCGIVLDEASPLAIADALAKLRDDRVCLSQFRAAAAIAADDLCWEKEKVAEQDLFRSVIEKKNINGK